MTPFVVCIIFIDLGICNALIYLGAGHFIFGRKHLPRVAPFENNRHFLLNVSSMVLFMKYSRESGSHPLPHHLTPIPHCARNYFMMGYCAPGRLL